MAVDFVIADLDGDELSVEVPAPFAYPEAVAFFRTQGREGTNPGAYVNREEAARIIAFLAQQLAEHDG